MHVACFCGTEFRSDEDLAHCPDCLTPAVLPNVSARDVSQMRLELAQILGEHEPRQANVPAHANKTMDADQS